MERSEPVLVDLDSESEGEMLPLRERLMRKGCKASPSKSRKLNTSIHRVSSSSDSDSSLESFLVQKCSQPRKDPSAMDIDYAIDDGDVVGAAQVFAPMSKLIKRTEFFPSNHCTVQTAEDEDKPVKKATRKRVPAKSADAEKRLEEREKKRQAKLLEKALKDAEKELKRSMKPEECIKSMRLTLDSGFNDVSEAAVLYNFLLDRELSYSHQENAVPLSVQWYRRITEIDVVGSQVQKKELDQLEDSLLVFIPPLQFTDLVYAYSQKCKGKQTSEQTILEYVMSMQDLSPHMRLTCVTVGLEPYLGRKAEAMKDPDICSVPSQRSKCVYKKDVDEAVIALNLEAHITYYCLKDMEEFGNLLVRFTKAIAETPFKRGKQQQQQAFSWYAEADSSRPVKVEKDGKGFINLWQQQILQFQNVGKETAQAIAAKFPSPYLLVQAYKQCSSQKEAESLLQDIVVRRDYGPLSTTRRVGPELSYKIYRFFTSKDGNELLQR